MYIKEIIDIVFFIKISNQVAYSYLKLNEKSQLRLVNTRKYRSQQQYFNKKNNWFFPENKDLAEWHDNIESLSNKYDKKLI